MIEELIQQLVRLQAEQKAEEDARDGDGTVISLREAVADAKGRLEMAEKALADDLAYYDPTIAGTIRDIETVKAQIIDKWTGEDKTMVFDAGTLKFTTRGSLKIIDKTLTLTGLLDHTSVKDVATNYIRGFNLTAVKKYMGVLELPMGAAGIEYKTTVKLEQKSG